MKRLLLFPFILLFTVAVTAVSAQPAAQRGPGQGRGPNFVDANGDGICDHFQAGGAGRTGGPGGCRWCAFGGSGGSLVGIAAAKLGSTRADVVTALRSGKTFAQLMEANGKTSQDLVDAVVASRKAAVDRAVANNTLTAQAADDMIARMRTHVSEVVSQGWQPGGPGWGHHGRHHHGNW